MKKNRSKQLLSYVSRENYFTNLHLGEHNVCIQSHNGCIKAMRKIVDEDRFSYIIHGNATYKFTKAMTDYNSFCETDKQNIQDFNDVLILGMLCEAICKVAIPIKVLTENIDLVEEFINVSIIHSDYKNFDYQFDFNRAMNLLRKSCSDLFSNFIKNFILLGRKSDYSVVCKACLRLTHNVIYIEGEGFEKASILLPDSIAYSHIHFREFNYIYDAIVWFLFAKVGLYLDLYNNFCVFEQTSNSKLLTSWLFDFVVFNPDNGANLFRRKCPNMQIKDNNEDEFL